MSKKVKDEKNKKPSTNSNEDKSKDKSIQVPPVENIDVYDGNWKQYCGPIFHNPTEKVWYCEKCDDIIDNPKAAYSHAKNAHSLDPKEEPEVDETSTQQTSIKSETTSKKSTQQKSDIHTGEKPSEIWRKIVEDGENSNNVDSEVIDQVFNINRQKLSKSAAEIVNNPYIMYVFAESKKKHYLSPYVDFGAFIENCVHIWISSMKIKAYFEIDMVEARANPNIARIIQENEKDWEEFKDTHGIEVPTIE